MNFQIFSSEQPNCARENYYHAVGQLASRLQESWKLSFGQQLIIFPFSTYFKLYADTLIGSIRKKKFFFIHDYFIVCNVIVIQHCDLARSTRSRTADSKHISLTRKAPPDFRHVHFSIHRLEELGSKAFNSKSLLLNCS